MRTSASGIKLIEDFEGYRLQRYRDAVGVYTIGYGTTAADIGTVPASCTREQAEKWLRDNLARKYEPAVNGLGVPLTQNQFDALVSFVYNCGPGALAGTTIGGDLRARNYRKAADDLLAWDKAGGRTLAGLTRRRQAERALFLTASTASTAKELPSDGAVALGIGAMVDGRFEVFVEPKDGEIFHAWQSKQGGWAGAESGKRVAQWQSLGIPGKT